MRLKRIAAASEKAQDSPSYSSTTVTAVSNNTDMIFFSKNFKKLFPNERKCALKIS